jgi:hypothetical protein
MPDVAMSSTSRHEDGQLLKAIEVGLANARQAGAHYRDDLCADHVAATLTDYGLVLPVGVTIRSVEGGWLVQGDGVDVTTGSADG